MSLYISVEQMCVLLVSDLLKRVLKQSLSGHGDLDMAGQGIGLERETKQTQQIRIIELEHKSLSGKLKY